MVQINFDATQIEPNEGRPDPVPSGWYDMTIVESEAKQTAKKTGYFLALTWQVISGEYKGRKVFQNVNLQNPNEQATQIGRGELSAICHAAGILQVQDSTQLHNVPMLVKVSLTSGNDGYEPRNEIKAVKAAQPGGGAPGGAPGGQLPWQQGGAPGGAPGGMPQMPQQQGGGMPGQMPWQQGSGQPQQQQQQQQQMPGDPGAMGGGQQQMPWQQQPAQQAQGGPQGGMPWQQGQQQPQQPQQQIPQQQQQQQMPPQQPQQQPQGGGMPWQQGGGAMATPPWAR